MSARSPTRSRESPTRRDPRRVARRAEEHLRETGIADTAHFGPECEFFVFDAVSYTLDVNRAGYEVDSSEGHWNSGEPGLGYTVREKGGYFPPAPHDTLADLRTEMVLTLERLGIPCEFHHHEVASGGQCEIDLRYQPLLRMADQVMHYKYVVRNVARAAGKSVTFMPKPLYADNGSGMHTHQSLWLAGTPLMADKSGYAGLSKLARCYIGGLLAHAGALLAFCAPTTNSYRRLVPGFEAPVNLVYSAAEPLCGDQDSDVLELTEGEADRVPMSGRCRESVPRVLGDADGRPGRDPAEPGSGCPVRLRPLRGGHGRQGPGAGIARGGIGRARGRPRLPARRATSSART